MPLFLLKKMHSGAWGVVARRGSQSFFFWLVGFLSSQKMSAYNSNRFRADGCLLFVRCSRALANFHFLPTIESHLGIIA